MIALATACTTSLAVADGDRTTGFSDDDAPIAELMKRLPEEVQIFNSHLMTLANPFMEGRLSGTNGMEVAKQYMAYWFDAYGLEPAFSETDSAGNSRPFSSWRQPFPLGNNVRIEGGSISAGTGGNAVHFAEETDFVVTSMGGSGDVTAPVSFIGYSIDEGPDGYSSFQGGEDLSGRIAVMFRFEPMDENGLSLWSTRGPWTGYSSYTAKVRAAAKRNPEAIIVVNTPGADDPRADRLSSSGGSHMDVPVFMMSSDAAKRLVRATDSKGRSLMDLRRIADKGGPIVHLDGQASVSASVDSSQLMGENVAGVLHGKGHLANEWIVIGAHLDHLGMGEFGSRSGPGELHPGADDNASGSAGVLLFAKKLVESYAKLPENAAARSVLFMGFDAEESGLNGSRYYADNPIVPIEDHVLMINYDMIGRIVNGRLSVSGTRTGRGMHNWLQPYFDASPLTIVQPEQMSGASDHTSFYRKQMPVLFAIIADFHEDYHTPADVDSKINRVGAVETIRLFHDLTLDYAQLSEAFPYADPNAAPGPSETGPSLSDIRVRVGIVPASYEEGQAGIPVRSVTADSPAAKAGVKADDRLVAWNGREIDSVIDWMSMLVGHKPGDIVNATLLRNDEEVVVKITLGAKQTGGN